MFKFLIPLCFAILASATENTEVVDLQPAGTFGLGLGLGGLGLGWNPKRIIIPKSYGWEQGGYIPAVIDGGHYGPPSYPSLGWGEIPVKSLGYGWGEQGYPSAYGFSNYIVDNGPGWGWDGAGAGYGGIGPY